MQGKNMPAVILCGVASLFILIGSFTTSWAGRSKRGTSVSVGTSGGRVCWRGECRTKKFDPDRMRRAEDKLVYTGGKAVFGWGMINFLLFAAAAVLLFLGHSSSHIPPRIGLFTAILSLLLGAGFVVMVMAAFKGKPMLTPGYSFYLHNLGCVAGIIGAAMAWKKAVPGAGSMPGPMGQPMPGQPMPGQPMPGQPMPGQPMPGQPMPGQAMPGQPMPGQPMDPNLQAQAMPGQPMPGQPMPGQPMDPNMQAQAPGVDPNLQAQAQAQTAPCQTCGGAARWVPEHSRWYCDACQQYV